MGENEWGEFRFLVEVFIVIYPRKNTADGAGIGQQFNARDKTSQENGERNPFINKETERR